MSDPILPEHLVEMAVEPKLQANQDKLMSALKELGREDPSFSADTDPESGQTIIKGMSERHLDIKVETLRNQHKIDVNLGAPLVSYRETITRRTEVDYTHKRQSGDAGQFARVKFVVEPGTENSGVIFMNKLVGNTVPEQYLPGIEKGLNSVMTSGNIIGFPMVDVKVTLIDGACHEVDSSAIAFEIAARGALREALTRAGPVLLEPIMKVEIVSPEEYVGSVTGDLTFRRGRIADTTARGNAQAVNAMVPLANMFDYENDLRTMSRGRATCTLSFDRYEKVSRSPDGPGPDNAPPAAMAMRA